MRPFLEVLTEEGILADGAMGTEIYARGVFINKCFDELNLTNPSLIGQIHEDYVKAGSTLIETNTFTSNRPALASYGLEDKVDAINKAGVEIAKKAAGKNVFVAGAVGPVRWAIKSADVSSKELEPIFKEQITSLARAGVDVILFETFTDLGELKAAFNAAKSVCHLPIVTEMSLKYLGENGFAGIQPEDAAKEMASWGADVIGVNCSDGPHGVFEAVKRMSQVVTCPLSAMPNAGLPKMIQGRLIYLASPEYMAEYARRYAQLGVALIGGCCGTTPAHIREMKRFLKSVRPVVRTTCSVMGEKKEPPGMKQPIAERGALAKKIASDKFIISVEVDPPLGTDPTPAIEGARFLKNLGVDAINIADGPRAMARMSPIALGVMIKEKVGIDPVVHFCCRDRNLLGMQMDLIGASALGMNNLLIITGDPPKMGNYPEASAVFDLDAIGLIRFASLLNRGLDLAERPLQGQTKFLVGCGVNPGAIELNLEVERFHQKLDAGAEFAFTQPVYDADLLDKFFEKAKPYLKIPIIVGILPLASLRNAEFLHNEVPGMQIPSAIMNRMKNQPDRKSQQEEGITIASEALDFIRNYGHARGAYIFPPFGNYEAVAKLLER